MKNPALLILLLAFLRCSSSSQKKAEETHRTIVGAEILVRDYIDSLKNKNVALVLNQTSVAYDTPLVDTLLSRKIHIKKIFAPEHGYRGDLDAGEIVKDTIDAKTGLPVFSLYNFSSQKPQKDFLKDMDIIIFDIQDVGARFYTFISTLYYVMEASAENNTELWICDRPNPNGNYVAGPVLKEKYKSFVGMLPVPIVYGMTIGEYATMINEEGWLKNKMKCKLKIIKMKNWNHNMRWGQTGLTWIKPSPNIPDTLTAYWYPAMCWFEGVDVSIGRGTMKPFLQVGHPDFDNRKDSLLWNKLKLKPVSFVPKEIPGMAKEPKYEGETCYGVQINYLPDDPESLFIISYILLEKFYEQSRDKKKFFEEMFYLLCGTEKIKESVLRNVNAEILLTEWEKDIQVFQQLREKYLLY